VVGVVGVVGWFIIAPFEPEFIFKPPAL